MKISISAPYKCKSPCDVIYYPEIRSHFGKCLSDLKFCKSPGYFDKMCINGCADEQVESSRAVPWCITILLRRTKYPIWRNALPNLKFWAKSTTNKRWILGGSSPESHWICPSFWGLDSGALLPKVLKKAGEAKNKK
jgi:hypothetical protein